MMRRKSIAIAFVSMLALGAGCAGPYGSYYGGYDPYAYADGPYFYEPYAWGGGPGYFPHHHFFGGGERWEHHAPRAFGGGPVGMGRGFAARPQFGGHPMAAPHFGGGRFAAPHMGGMHFGAPAGHMGGGGFHR